MFHGTFGTGDLQPGKLTVGDCWKIIPYENMLATAERDRRPSWRRSWPRTGRSATATARSGRSR